MFHVFLVWPWIFEILNSFYLIWPFIPWVEKNFLVNGRTGYQKKWNCALISKMSRSLEFGKRKKIFLLKNWIFWTWKILQKFVLQRKIFWELLDARVLHIFEISAKFRFFWYPLRLISKKFFSTLLRDGSVFLEVNRSKKIETVQYFKKTVFIN
jgi:hypothetical protein